MPSLFKRNLGDADRVARLSAGALLSVIFLHQFREHGTLLGLFAAALLFTGLVGWCPLYALFRFSTVRPGDIVVDKT
jgi:hypothetical protein